MLVSKTERYLRVLGLQEPIELERALGRAPRRIGVVATHQLGDMLVTLPAVQALADHFPHAELTMLVARAQRELVSRQPFVHAAVELPSDRWAIFDQVQHFDLVLFFRKWEAEPAEQMRPHWYALSSDLLVGPPEPAHTHYLGALTMLGLQPKERRPRIALGAAEKEAARRVLSGAGFDDCEVRVAVHPGSHYVGKRWPAARYAAVLRWLWRCYDARFVLVQGRGEEVLVEQATAGIPADRIVVMAQRPLLELGAVLARCTFFLGNDTGVSHLADAVGLPCVTVFGPSRPNVWGPSGPACVHVVADEVWRGCTECSSRSLKDKPCARPEQPRCLEAIRPDDVAGAIESVAALTRLRQRFGHLDRVQVTGNLFASNLGRHGLALANLWMRKPLFALQGREVLQRCLKQIERHGSYRRVARRDPEVVALLDTLLAYRILLPAGDGEIPVPPELRRNLRATLGHPVMLKLGAVSQPATKRRGRSLPPPPPVRRRFRRRRLRILLANGISTQVYGGGERWMLRVGVELIRRGHDVLCWGLAGHPWLNDASQRGMTCLAGSVPETFEMDRVQSRARHLARLGLDAAVLGQDRELLSLGLSLRVAEVPVVLARKGLPITDDRPMVRWAHAAVAHGVLTPSERTRQEIAGLGWMPPDRIRSIPNGVDVAALRRAGRGWEVLRDDLGLSPGQPVILNVGRLSKHKGTLHLIRAFARVLSRFPQARLLIVGVGPRDWALSRAVNEERVGGAVRFLGERWDVPRLLRLADCFVLPSLYEGMSTALLEAMACGVPVVATNVSGTPEVVNDGKTGLLVPPADPASLANVLGTILGDPHRAARLGRAARRHVEQHHGLARMVDEVEAILHNGW